MRIPVILPFILCPFAWASAANAAAHIHINLSTQTMHVQSSSGSYSWPVSTARAGYSTPRGSFAPTGLQPMHYSRKYHMSPMPHSIFFRGGYAIHGSYATGMLGRPASHGCVRLSPGHAAMLYQMVRNEGGRISITGSPPHGQYYASARRGGRVAYAASRGRHSYGDGYAVADPFAALFGGGLF
ncbi:L,D-transpeptidase [Methylocystis sp. FS]|uniref:L,D-transpeptidase n=1 Tax=Methylocystis silviterrae TaxID=2743612 RepID=UPI001582A7DA|nr:L,D-transpeptidase [Methylocystis silviterrae]NUJ79881.1 L,D-transpeptidase [Methylocystis silviterrae]